MALMTPGQMDRHLPIAPAPSVSSSCTIVSTCNPTHSSNLSAPHPADGTATNARQTALHNPPPHPSNRAPATIAESSNHHMVCVHTFCACCLKCHQLRHLECIIVGIIVGHPNPTPRMRIFSILFTYPQDQRGEGRVACWIMHASNALALLPPNPISSTPATSSITYCACPLCVDQLCHLQCVAVCQVCVGC